MKLKEFNISEEVKIVIKDKRGSFDEKSLDKFEKASEEFEKLVKKGLLKKRGFTLITIEEKHLSTSLYSSNF